MTCGIYKLNFKDTAKVYIGQALNIQYRFKGHLRRLHKGTASIKMQQAYKCYGEPTVEILEECTEDMLNTRELYHIFDNNSVVDGLNTLIPGSLEGAHYIHNTANAQYGKQVYVSILDMLVNTTLTADKVAEILSVSKYIVRQIASLTSHKWLKIDHPEMYGKLELQAKIGRNSIIHSSDRNTLLISPEEEEIPVINILKFTTDYSLPYGSIYSLIQGNILHFKGWRLKGTPKVPYTNKEAYPSIVSPDGNIHQVPDRGISKFAINNGLHISGLRRLLLKLTHNYKGWTLCP